MVVVGYGWCGRGIAQYARAFGADVMVVERDEIKALEAAVDGFRVGELAIGARWGNVFITATGAESVIGVEELGVVGDGAILANAGHFDTEIDVPALRAAATSSTAPTPGIERLDMGDGRTLTLLSGGRMFNLGGPSPKGNSIEAMDLGFALQARSLERVATDAESLAAGAQPVPDDINRRAAASMVRQMMGP
jgi:adenosylhomocysteinase